MNTATLDADAMLRELRELSQSALSWRQVRQENENVEGALRGVDVAHPPLDDAAKVKRRKEINKKRVEFQPAKRRDFCLRAIAYQSDIRTAIQQGQERHLRLLELQRQGALDEDTLAEKQQLEIKLSQLQQLDTAARNARRELLELQLCPGSLGAKLESLGQAAALLGRNLPTPEASVARRIEAFRRELNDEATELRQALLSKSWSELEKLAKAREKK